MADDQGKLILEMHFKKNESSPLQYISAELLAHYRTCEAELMALRAAENKLPEDCQVASQATDP